MMSGGLKTGSCLRNYEGNFRGKRQNNFLGGWRSDITSSQRGWKREGVASACGVFHRAATHGLWTMCIECTTSTSQGYIHRLSASVITLTHSRFLVNINICRENGGLYPFEHIFQHPRTCFIPFDRGVVFFSGGSLSLSNFGRGQDNP